MGYEKLKPSLRHTLKELKNCICSEFPNSKLILFGSVVRGETGPESDVDVLIILPEEPRAEDRSRIVRQVFEINLHYDTNISVIIVGRENWERGPLSVMPLKREVEDEGVPV